MRRLSVRALGVDRQPGYVPMKDNSDLLSRRRRSLMIMLSAGSVSFVSERLCDDSIDGVSLYDAGTSKDVEEHRRLDVGPRQLFRRRVFPIYTA